MEEKTKTIFEDDYIENMDKINTIINKEFDEGIPTFTNETALLAFYFEKTYNCCNKIKETEENEKERIKEFGEWLEQE